MSVWQKVFLGGWLLLLLCGCSLGGGYLTPTAGTGNVGDLAGTYAVRGKAQGGGTYTGSLTIERAGEVYNVTWNLDDGTVVQGVGLLEGDLFSVAWDAGGAPGLVVYRVGADGRLTGRWTVAGEKTTWSETATRR